MSDMGSTPSKPAPQLGQHTADFRMFVFNDHLALSYRRLGKCDAVLDRLLGFSGTQIADLRKAGAIG